MSQREKQFQIVVGLFCSETTLDLICGSKGNTFRNTFDISAFLYLHWISRQNTEEKIFKVWKSTSIDDVLHRKNSYCLEKNSISVPNQNVPKFSRLKLLETRNFRKLVSPKDQSNKSLSFGIGFFQTYGNMKSQHCIFK